jgi:carbamate kinase
MSRIVVALGGNAIVSGDDTGPGAQQAAVEGAMEQVAALVAAGHEVVLTHGNGPQVGNLLVKNAVARHLVPPVPLHWCVAQTQATIGYLMANALERSLRALGCPRPVSVIVTRVAVGVADPAWSSPTKPIGRFLPESEACERIAEGEVWRNFGDRGWRRVVASPEPLEILERQTVLALIEAGTVVVAAGGGGIPIVREGEDLRGVEAVVDKDLSGALLAGLVGADLFVIATDVRGAALRFGAADQEWLGRVSAAELRSLANEGFFADGSMGPKVEAALRFVEGGGSRSAITSLHELTAAVEGRAGTIVERERS